MTQWNAVGAPSIIRKDDNDLGDLNLYISQYWCKNGVWKSIWVTTSAVRPECAVNPCSHKVLWPYGMQLGRHQSIGKTTTTLATSIYTYANIGAKNGVLEVHLNNLTDATLPMLFLHRTNCTNIHVDSYCYHDFLKLGRILNNENEAVEIIEKSRDFF